MFLTLNTFSATGGIEKVCRIASKALCEITAEAGDELLVFSMYDETKDLNTQYLPTKFFKGFGGQRISFVASAVKSGIKSDIVILSHLNLLLVGYLIKFFSPKTKLVLVAHGIEVWGRVSLSKYKMLAAIDLFLPVSSFTSEKLTSINKIPADRVKVLNNCLDPYLDRKSDPEKEKHLRTKYGFQQEDTILLTLARLKFSEQYKGYDRVIEAFALLKDTHPHIRYLIVGRYDAEEKARLDKIVLKNSMEGKVFFAGFVPDEDLVAHFNIADIYIMPSSGEGFGVVFIEALFHGKPVIAGNADGSVDALANGEFGLLVNPNSLAEISKGIVSAIDKKEKLVPNDKALKEKFGFTKYKERLASYIQ